MAGEKGGGSGLTVGSLLGVPLGTATGRAQGAGAAGPGEGGPGPTLPAEVEASGWSVVAGRVSRRGARPAFRPDGVEALTYDNPFDQVMERVWFDGKTVFAVDLGEVEVDPGAVKVAQEYQVVYAVELDDRGKLAREPEAVPGQQNIYDSVPGMGKYSPIWQFNYVVVPRDYRPNRLRSERDCQESGYPILRSHVFEN